MNSDKRFFFGNTAFSMSCAFINGVCAYLTRRLTSNGLQGNEYAFFYSTFSLVCILIALFLLGIPNASFFRISDARNCGQDDAAHGIYAWCVRWAFLVGLFLTVVGLPAILMAGDSMERYGIDSRRVFRLLLLLPLPLSILNAMWQLLNGMKEFVASNLLQLWNVVAILAGVWLFQTKYGLPAVIAVYAFGAWCGALGGIWWAKRKHGFTVLHPIDPDVRRQLVKAGGWLLLSCTGYYFFAELGNVILSYVRTPEETLVFNIALPVALMIRPLYSISEVFAPFSNQLYHKGDTRALRCSVWSMLGVTGVMMVGAGVVFGFGGRWILTILFGEEFAGAATCTLILIEGALIWNAARFYADMLNSMRRERRAALITAGVSALSIMLYWLFSSWLGANGTAWAALIASVVWLFAALASVLLVLKEDAVKNTSSQVADQK
ncbi:MAG: hypothetical protein IJS14_07420 [Lentisphaeria bacterium]|nr:hypothetical protein [Lentisphaeria bacterium]